MGDNTLERLLEIPRDEAHKQLFRLNKGYELNLDNPVTYDEKLQWLIVYQYGRNVARFADKLEVRKYVEECGFGHMLTKIYAEYGRAEDIDISALPDKFVLKANHGSGPYFYAVCRDKNSFDAEAEKKKLSVSLRENYAKVALEYHYNYISPRLFAEEFIEDGTGELPTDYKIYCFNGVAKYVKVGADRAEGLKMAYYDENWVKQTSFVKPECDIPHEIPKPKNLEYMMHAASVLSAPFATARVDFYNVDGKIYFGEITLTPASGLSRRDKYETEKYFGELVDLSKWSPDMIPRPKTLDGGRMNRERGRVPKELIHEIKLNRDVMHLIDRTIPMMRAQNYDRGLREISVLMGWMAEISEYDEELISEAAGTLKEMLSAQTLKDYCLLTDYLEFLRTIFSERQAEISAEMGDECIYERERFRTAYSLCRESALNSELADVINHTPVVQKILDDGELVVEPCATMDATLKRSTPEGFVYYHSNSDPYQEGEELAERAWYSEEASEYAVFGLGLGYAPLALCKADPSIFVTVYETDARVIQLAFAYGVMDEILACDNIKIVFDEDGAGLVRAIKRAADCRDKEFRLVIHEPSLRCEKNSAVRSVLEDYQTQFVSILNQGRMLKTNFKINTRLVKNNISGLLKEIEGKDMILVAAGPSLDKNLTVLQKPEVRKNAVVVAVGTVFRKLMKTGIRPDFVIISDANERVLKQIEGVEESGVPLIILSTAYFGFAKNYKGPMYIAFQNGFEPAEKAAAEQQTPLINVGGSVATFGVSLGIAGKAARLIAMGLDLSYPGNRVHATDTSEQELSEVGGLRKIRSVDGGEVFTGTAFDIYRRFIEDEIAKAKACGCKTEFINATEGGAQIEGMKNQKLSDSLNVDFTHELLSREARNELMRRACMLIGGNEENSVKSIALDTLYGLAFYEDMSLEECWQIYRNIDRAVFVNNSLKLSAGTLTELYRYIFDFIKSNMNYEGKVRRPLSERNQNLVVFTISQFLTAGHAPTLRILDYAYTWKTKFGKDVLIINDAMMNYYRNENLDGVVAFNFIPELNEANTVTHRGETFDFYQVPCLMPDLSVLQVLMDNIYELNPLCVFNVGGSDILADLCTDFVTTLSQPCAFQIPVSETKYLLLGRDYEKSDDNRMALCSEGQELILTNFNYVSKPETKTYSRSDFGIPENSFAVCVVGNRIESEMDEEFLSMLGNALSKDERICAVFIGPVKDRNTIVNKMLGEAYGEKGISGTGEIPGTDEFPKNCDISGMGSVINGAFKADITDRIIFTGPVDEARSLIKHLDLCINPKRAGGGRAAFEAMYYNIPCISLRIGDAYYAGGSMFGADTLSDYGELILRYASDPDFYKKMGAAAKARANVLEDMQGTHEKILQRVLREE